MAKRVSRYQSTSGSTHPTLEEAVAADLVYFIDQKTCRQNGPLDRVAALYIVRHRDRVQQILDQMNGEPDE